MSEGKERKKRVVRDLKYSLPDPKLSFAAHFDIISAYVVASGNGKNPVGYKELKPYVKVSSTLVSGCNKFFQHLGLIEHIENSSKYKATPLAEVLHNAKQWNNEELKKSTLRKILENAWFWELTKQYLEINQKANKLELVQKLGYQCGADPKIHKNAINKLIDYLQTSELIIEVDGSFIINSKLQETSIKNLNEHKEISKNIPDQIHTKDITKTTLLTNSTEKLSVNFGIMINPETDEEQIRKAVRTVIDELDKIQKEKEEDSK